MKPSCLLIIEYVIANPSPLPLCFVLKYKPLSFEEAKHPFYPSLLGFFSLFFLIGLTKYVNTENLKKYWISILSLSFCALIFFYGFLKLRINTTIEPIEHIAIAHDLVELFSHIDKDKKVAIIWDDTISYDTLNYYLVQKGLNKLKNFFFKAPDGRVLNFGAGVPHSSLLVRVKD